MDRLGYFLDYEVYDRVFTSAHDRNSQWYGAFEVYLPVLLAGTLTSSAIALVVAIGVAGFVGMFSVHASLLAARISNADRSRPTRLRLT